MKKIGIRRKIDDLAGRVCEVLIPVNGEYFLGSGETLAVCTLGSIGLLREISHSRIMDKCIIAGRLMSENKGIDSLLTTIFHFPNLTTLILCGKEVNGHLPGHSLMALHQNGIDEDRRIIESRSSYPYLFVPDRMIASFRKRVCLVDMIGETSIGAIAQLVS